MKVLVAEDNPVFQIVLHGMLTKWGYDVLAVHNGDDAWAVLQEEGAPRLAILDWMMPGMDGPELCRRLRTAGREPYVYVLLLTARTESGDLVAGMEAGADDYLTKPFNTHELRVRLRAGTRIVELQEQLVQARDLMLRQAMYDGLTGLLNRTSVLDALQQQVARAKREHPGALALLMVDLDHFKQINDTYGHQAGDAVLREVACRMKAGARRYDAMGRYGGEEFLVVLPGCDEASGHAQAERLRHSISDTPVQLGDREIPVTCSVGLTWRTTPDPTADSLIQEADTALYAAKSGGRNRVEAFSRRRVMSAGH